MSPHSRRPPHAAILALLTTAGVALALMQTLVVPALPSLRRELGASAEWTTWIVTGFLLSSSVLTPIIGKLGDVHGKKKLLVASLAVFGLGSLGAALAPSLPWLIACRVVQGTGAAIFPLSFGIIRDEFPPEKIGVAVGVVSSVFGIGGGIGLVASGAILEHLDWRWLFVIGAVPVLAATALIARYVPESPVTTPSRPDYVGATTLSLALVALLVAISEGTAWGWTSPAIVALFAAAVALLAAWTRVERRAAEPMVDLRTLARPAMAATNAATALLGFALTGLFVLLPSFVEAPAAAGYGFAASPVEAGLYFLPFSAAMVVAGPLAGALGSRRGAGLPLGIGVALMGAALGMLALAHDDGMAVRLSLLVVGTGAAFGLAAVGALVIAHSRPDESGFASGMNSIMRTVGGAVGAQVAVAVVAAHGAAGSALPAESGYTIAFAIAAAAAAAALLPAAMLRRRRGARAPGVLRPSPAV
ncbi:MAG TPA: MFS transporter [Solirubrobacteraceae bacterium]|nr:MFS transporter [Solirubrobacteraceae bacterium]